MKTNPLRRRSLSRRFAIGSVLVTVATLVFFAFTAFVVMVISELAEANALSVSEVDQEAATNVLVAMAIALPFGIPLAVGASRWLTRRTLAPIAQVVAAAREATARNLTCRLPVPTQDDELRDLVLAENALFERLQVGFETLSQFAANASHEIRTPLAVAESELEIALRRPRSDEEWRAAAQRSLESLRQINQIVEALLQFARADAVLPGTEERADVRSTVERIISEHHAVAESHAITVSLEAADAPLIGRANDQSLAIAFSNLLSNAIRYTPERGRVLVTLEHSGATAIVRVEDDGPGVTGEEAVFQPFVRGVQGRRMNKRAEALRAVGQVDTAGLDVSIGLGLSITKRLVEHWGGSITVDRSPTLGGARFSMTLALVTSDQVKTG
ncbi:MAG: ATP-binding protein [Polyangiaceae bacterium]